MNPTYSPMLWPLAVYVALVTALMIGIMVLSYLLGEKHRNPATDTVFESGIPPVGNARLRLSARFYLIAMFFVIFDVEALFLFAWAVAARETGWAGYVEAVVFIAILLAALAYLWRVGALDWSEPRRAEGRAE
jgi:NADH-quinone oxidoreductase subunit A